MSADIRVFGSAERPLRVVHLSTLDIGGAGIAAYRLHSALQRIGIDSRMLVLSKTRNDPTVESLSSHHNWDDLWRRWQLGLKEYPHRPVAAEAFTDIASEIDLSQNRSWCDADIIHLHWVAGVMDWRRAPQWIGGRKIVWTLHDMNPFTGGCHFAGSCANYLASCGACPQLGSHDTSDISRRIFAEKMRIYSSLRMTVVTPSRWLGICSAQSPLLSRFEHRVIPYGFPLDVFQPGNRHKVREELGIPRHARVVLTGADWVQIARKGYRYFLKAIAKYRHRGPEQLLIAIFGRFHTKIELPSQYPTFLFGSISDEHRLAMIYNAADLFVFPSLEDNLPNTVIEAMACGTPSVASGVGGVPDIVDHGVNGYLAHPGDVRSLVDGIKWALSSEARLAGMRDACVEKAKANYEDLSQARNYEAVYRSLLASIHAPSGALGRIPLFADTTMSKPSTLNAGRNRTSKRCTVFVDHGEAYGNLGEEAMILNALRRIEAFLQPEAIHLIHEPGKPLPWGDNPHIHLVPSPLPAFRRSADHMQRGLAWLRKLPVLKRRISRPGIASYWRLVAKMDALFPRWIGLRGNREVRQFLDALKHSTVYYHVGMSGLNEFWEPGLVYKRWVAQQAKPWVKLIVYSSQGLGPVQSASARSEMKELLSLADLVTLRDHSYGANLLRDLNVARPESRVVFDEAFSFAAADEPTAREWLAKAGLSYNEPFVAFHYREKDYTSNRRDPTARLAGLLQGIHSETGISFLFVPMSYAEHSCVDVKLGCRLSEFLGRPEWYRVLPECRDVSILKAVVGMAKFSIGLSYHINVFSLTQGHPALILYTGAYYGLKSDGLIGFYGLPSQALDLDKAGDYQVVGAVREILHSYERACRDISAVNRELKKTNDWTLEEVRERLDPDGVRRAAQHGGTAS